MNTNDNTSVLKLTFSEVEEHENCTVNAIDYVYHPVEELHSAKCPHCGESYYRENYSTVTAVYYPPIYKDGVNINPDKNESTTYCTCMNCGKDFTY